MKCFTGRSPILGIVLAVAILVILAVQVQAEKSPDKKININTASTAELQKLPRIGAVVAQRIIDFREKHGRFKKIAEIMKIKGIGEKTYLRIKDLITVGEASKTKKEKGI